MPGIEEWSQVVSCRDVAGRGRSVRILLDREGLVVVSPPGEQIRLYPQEAAYLEQALHEGCERFGGLRSGGRA